MEKGKDPVLVTTQWRGVFFGYLVGEPGERVAIHRARNCLWWPQEQQGFLGLATTGPIQGARVGPPADELVLYGVTAIARCTDEAAQRWEDALWN